MEINSQEILKLKDSLTAIANKINSLHLKQEAIFNETKKRFNVFTILLKAHDETRLHSRFIGSLLNSDGSHDCGRLFLDLFLDTLKPIFNLRLNDTCNTKPTIEELRKQDYKVHLEYHTGSYGNIDILLEFENYLIIIENKIWAMEQVDQIKRYVNFIEKSNKQGFVLYLTLNGKKSNTAGGKDYYGISYIIHIQDWLNRCLKATYEYININQVIQQYRNVLNKLTENTLETKSMNEIKKMILENPLIIKYDTEFSNAISEAKKELFDKTIKTIAEYSGNYTFKSLDKKQLVLLEHESVLLFGKAQIKIAWDNSLDLYIGIATDDWDSEKQNCFERENHQKIENIFNAVNNVMENYYKRNPYWPAATFVLKRNFASNDFLCRVARESDRQELAIEIAEKIKTYIDIVKTNWGKQ